MARKDVENVGVYDNLIAQVDKIFKHNNQGSYETRHRYYEAVDRFCQFAADEFKLQKFSNVKEKHIVAYYEYMRDFKENAPKTIRTDLSAIRMYYDQSGGKNQLPSNNEIDAKMERSSYVGKDRAWTETEYHSALSLTKEMGNEKIGLAMELAWSLGLRIHEVVRLDHAQLVAALKNGYLEIKGKGGKVRRIPLRAVARDVMERVLQTAERGQKVFVEPWQKAHKVIDSIQNWIWRHREKFADRKITFHGLRHRYARREYEKALERLKDEQTAREYVSQLLGHERDEVTRVYLGQQKSRKSA